MILKSVGQKSAQVHKIKFVSSSHEADLSCYFTAKDGFDASFIKQNTWLQDPPVHLHEYALRALVGRISRNPQDLYSLVKRIYLLKALNQPEKLAGAVYDLFHCLQHRGASLRARILTTVHPLLSKHDYTHLTKMDAQPTRLYYPAPFEHALFNRGNWGSLNIVEKRNVVTHTETSASPLNEAKELLNQGEIAAAIRILEDCLAKTPQDTEISHELFLIYTHMHNFNAIAKLRIFLDERSIPYPLQWAETEKKLRDKAARS